MIVAFDQSLNTTGWAIFNDKKEFIACGKWTITANAPLGNRLKQFLGKVYDLYHEYHFNEMVFEDIQMQMGNVETYKKLAYVQAMLHFFCEKEVIPYEVYAPSHWRSILKKKYNISFGRKRIEQKQVAKDFVSKQYNIEVTEDECDAICLGQSYCIENIGKTSAF